MPAAAFDVVFVRQGLHHARDLVRMLREYFRVLRAGGVLLACREHVVDDREASLRAFLESQPDHQLYGGENAFTLSEYRSAVEGAGFELCLQIAPYDSPINLHPNTLVGLGEKILASRPGSALRLLLPDALVVKIGMAHLRRARLPGRLYSFLAIKPH
jgi:SAM-dependent methyltransferase